MVREDVRCLAIVEAVLTIGYQVSRYALHVVHLSQTAHRVLDEEKPWSQFADEFKRVAVHSVGKGRFLRLGIERAGHGVLLSVVSDGCDAECRAIVATPNDVGSPEVRQYLLGCQLHDVYVQGRWEFLFPIDCVTLVPSCSECVAYALRSAE
jgi:hypothetical protein